MILVTLIVTAPPGRREEMLEIFWPLLEPIQAEPGCRACRLYQEACGGDDILYMEEWDTQEQLERHMRSGRYERLLAVMEASVCAPLLHYRTVSAIRGLDYLEVVRLGTGPNNQEHTAR